MKRIILLLSLVVAGCVQNAKAQRVALGCSFR